MKLASTAWKQCILDGAGALGISIDKRAADCLARHAAELSIWNRKINLTGIDDAFEIAIKHYVDSIAIVPMVPEDSSVLDIGSGAGFPGIPIKVVMPSLSVILIDASRKKISFLRHVIRTLQLKGIEAHHCRAEAIATVITRFSGQPILAIDGFDVIICRAITTLDNLARMALPLLAEKGTLIAMKGNVAESELDSLRSTLRKTMETTSAYKSNFSIRIKRYMLPYLNAERSIVCIEQEPNVY